MCFLQLATVLLSLQLSLGAFASPVNGLAARDSSPTFVSQVDCDGKKYIYERLAGAGLVPNDARDRYGDTMSIGSSIALDLKAWKKKDGVYTGILWGLPDRGWYVHHWMSWMREDT